MNVRECRLGHSHTLALRCQFTGPGRQARHPRVVPGISNYLCMTLRRHLYKQVHPALVGSSLPTNNYLSVSALLCLSRLWRWLLKVLTYAISVRDVCNRRTIQYSHTLLLLGLLQYREKFAHPSILEKMLYLYILPQSHFTIPME